MSARVFCHSHRVSYAECTVGNHVYYARYLDLLEEARGEFFRQLGRPLRDLQAEDLIFPVVAARLRYHAAARYDDQLTIEVRVTLVRRVRLNLAHRILNAAGRLLVEAEIEHVCTNTADQPQRLPAELEARLQPYVAAASADEQ